MIIIGRKADKSEPPGEADIEFRRKENWMEEDEGECFEMLHPVHETSNAVAPKWHKCGISFASVFIFALAISLLPRIILF